MTPEPIRPVPSSPSSPMAPPYVDENVNEVAIEQGLKAAENELRDLVADTYEEAAKDSGDPETNLDDIDRTETE